MAETNEQALPGRARILVADDHPLVLERVIALLQTPFEIVGTASNGREMISDAIRLNPDVIVLDISMPEINGIEAARQLRAKGTTAKLVFLTVHSEDEFIEACLAAGGLGYVVKAYMKRDLIAAIQAALSDRPFISCLA